MAVAAVDQRFDLASNPATTGITAGIRQRTYNLGVKVLGCVVRDQRDRLQETRASISGVVPLGSGEIHVGYDHSTLGNDLALSNGAHPLGVTQSVAGRNPLFAGTSQTAQPFTGGKSTGFEVGLRHFF